MGSNPTADLEVYQAETSLGQVVVACTARGIGAVFIGDDSDALYLKMTEVDPLARMVGAETYAKQLATEAVQKIETGAEPGELPLDLVGTDFQRRVWRALREIPLGTTATYSEIAERIDRPQAVRAVASACAANRIAVLIPCHRAVRKDGGLGGYRWGVDRKKRLLEMERAGVEALEPGRLA
ncbi:MAG TPA: methylated-DNA--[protein]-cysteine S-methyltransferase [Longimicrobiaceae bacterium]|nr:methylated-DNA--[protein]-cysteine S-methyltransferase [Longimicrobiaceae bacterium]